MKTEIAKLLYETYCAAVGGKAFNGDPLPAWDEFVADEKKKLQSDAWLKAAEAVSREPLALLGDGMFANRLTAQKTAALMDGGMTVTGFVLTKPGEAEHGQIAIVDKAACRWLKRDELQDLMHGKPQLTDQDCQLFKSLGLEKLSLVSGDIVLVTVPKEVPLSPQVQSSLAGTFTNLLHDKGVRVLIKNADIAVDKLADLLTADDLAKMAQRMEQKKLAEPVAPEQNKTV
jgi:hypothetical protein